MSIRQMRKTAFFLLSFLVLDAAVHDLAATGGVSMELTTLYNTVEQTC